MCRGGCRPGWLTSWQLSARCFGADEPVALEHQALLTYPDGLPVAEVLERYPSTLFTAP
jgi:hypothetical protein